METVFNSIQFTSVSCLFLIDSILVLYGTCLSMKIRCDSLHSRTRLALVDPMKPSKDR